MTPEEQKQWKQLDQDLAEAERYLLVAANLKREGVPIDVSQQMRIDALMDADARLSERIARLRQKQEDSGKTGKGAG
jgi:hypothetical protein